jgi:serine/threonine-protein kinase
VGTNSLPALKAFLQGERFLRRFALDSAITSYDRAVTIDTTFALSLRRLQLAIGWNDSGGPVDYFARAAALNHGLSVRDSLLVLSDSGFAGPASLPNHPANRSAVQRRVAILEEAARRYPEDPEVWYHLGEVRFHSGFVVGNTWNDARAAFDRAIALDSGFAPAYVHPVEIALNENDPHAALRYVRGYLGISSVIPGGAAMHLLAEVLDPQGPGPRDVARDFDTASPAALHLLALAVQSWPDVDETQLHVWPRVIATRRGRLSPRSSSFYPWLPVYLSMVPRVLIYRGHLQEARSIVGNHVGAAFMELAELGLIPRETVETALSEWFHHPSEEDLSLYPRVAAGPCHRTLDAALWWAVQKDTASLQRLVRREASAARTVNPLAPINARPVPELASAALALARGDTTSALSRFLAFPDSLCPDAGRLREVRFRLLAAAGRDSEAAAVFDRSHDRRVPLMLERARLAERLGDRPTALHYYQFVFQAWQHADPELQAVVAQARAAIVRLGGDPRR